jgi:hypothetical protein
MTPMTPSTPSGKRKLNPLQDLMETEKIYVDQLTGIIRVRLRPLDTPERGLDAVRKWPRRGPARISHPPN